MTAVASVFGHKKSNNNSNKRKKQVVSGPADSVNDGRSEKLPLVCHSNVTFDMWMCFHSWGGETADGGAEAHGDDVINQCSPLIGSLRPPV